MTAQTQTEQGGDLTAEDEIENLESESLKYVVRQLLMNNDGLELDSVNENEPVDDYISIHFDFHYRHIENIDLSGISVSKIQISETSIQIFQIEERGEKMDVWITPRDEAESDE